ncbi:uncharacterized protein [Anabrus simplex]|uniref:uncharacterized protein isoform X2 n=1 Tax=Anabrus simplex TaxID=316456 RepID=UPI0034DD8597
MKLHSVSNLGEIAGLFSVYFLLNAAGGCLGLRDVRVSVPPAIMRGETAILFCHFDLEGDTLYSVKWYKGRREFYRYTPKEEPAMKIFPIQGLNVDRKQSSDRKLTLKRLEPTMSGRYSCEVSADAPSFHTSLVSADMEVVVPSDRPTITGVRSRYRVGDILHSNCSSSWSRPPAKLSWVVNEIQASAPNVIHYSPRRERNGDRESSLIGLRLKLQPQHFEGGRLKVRCIASIHDVYWQSTEKSVEEDRPRTSQQETVGPELFPSFPEISTIHPRFMDELDEEYNDIDDLPDSISSAPCARERYLLLASWLLLLVAIR